MLQLRVKRAIPTSIPLDKGYSRKGGKKRIWRDYYEILGYQKDASKDRNKISFQEKSRELHPDVNKAPDAEEKNLKNSAKLTKLLSDENKRATYDRYGEDWFKKMLDLIQTVHLQAGFGDLNDIFESFFGGFGGFGFGGGIDPNAPQRGDDLRYDIKLKFEDAAFGINKEIKI